MDLGRVENIDTLVRRREAVERRLSSSLRHAELVDGALAELDHQLAEAGEAFPSHALRASARALLGVAAGEEGYDATLVPAGSRVAVRVRNTLFGLQADVVLGAVRRPAEGQGVEQPALEQGALKGQPENHAPQEAPRLNPDRGPRP
jgi:hypothetical protein